MKKPPKTLGACADKLFKLREEKAAIMRAVAKLDEETSILKNHIIEHLAKDDAQGILGKIAKAKINVKLVPSVTDWPKLYKHILKTKDFSLLQKRPHSGAFKELWEDGKKIPGVEQFGVKEISITKL